MTTKSQTRHRKISSSRNLAIVLAGVASLCFFLGTPQLASGQASGDAAAAPRSATLPKCTDRIAGLPVPDAPHGLFVTLFPDQGQMMSRKGKYLVNNPMICGGNVYVQWSQVDKGPDANPRYDWGWVDSRMEPWIKAGKRVNFIVWPSNYGRNWTTPKYVMDKVAAVNCDRDHNIPVTFEKEFIRNYQEFMGAFVRHYETNASVGYIRFGLGIGGENHPACMQEQKAHYGWTEERWTNYLLMMFDYEKSLNSQKQLMSTMIGMMPSISREIAPHAAKLGFGLGIQGLAKNDIEAYGRRAPCKGDWCGQFDSFYGKVPLELQTLAKTDAGQSGIGMLDELLQFGLQRHAQIFELYGQDWLIAYDPDDPLYPQYHVEYQRALERAASVVGASP
jgi:hypothetical protein